MFGYAEGHVGPERLGGDAITVRISIRPTDVEIRLRRG